MRSAFVHEATIELSPGADESAPGAAVTVGLCGHWEHEGACHWPHHTSVDHRSGRTVRIRTVFACEPDDEPAVRRRISDALRSGQLDAPRHNDRWTTVVDQAGELHSSDAALAARLSR